MTGQAQALTLQSPRENTEYRNRALEVARQTLQQPAFQAQGAPPRVDEAQLSDELLEEVGRAGGPQSGNNVDALLRGFADQWADKQGNATGDGGGAGKKKQRVEREAFWTPTTREGEIHPGRDVIGNVEVKERKVEEPAQSSGTRGAAGGGAGAPGARGGGGPAAARAAPASAPKNGNSNGNGQKGDGEQGEDRIELSPESQQMASQMAGAGLQAPGMPGAQGSGGQNGGGEGGGAGSFEVRTRATGVSQTVRVEGSGKLGPNSFLRTFEKKDDSPLLEAPTMHRRRGPEIAQDLEERARRGEQVDFGGKPLTPELLERLRNPRENGQ